MYKPKRLQTTSCNVVVLSFFEASFAKKSIALKTMKNNPWTHIQNWLIFGQSFGLGLETSANQTRRIPKRIPRMLMKKLNSWPKLLKLSSSPIWSTLELWIPDLRVTSWSLIFFSTLYSSINPMDISICKDHYLILSLNNFEQSDPNIFSHESDNTCTNVHLSDSKTPQQLEIITLHHSSLFFIIHASSFINHFSSFIIDY